MRMHKLTPLIFAVLLASCSYNVNKNKSAADSSGQIQKQSVSGYDAVSSTIIGPSCLSCHSNATGNRGGLNLETYESVKLKLNQIYLRSIERQDMPPGGLESSQRDLLKNWIENGASQQATQESLEIKGSLGWSDIKSKILLKKCLDCHSPPNPEGNLDLNNYDVVKSQVNSIFDRVFVKQNMPLSPYPSLSLAEKNALLKWISQGLPQ